MLIAQIRYGCRVTTYVKFGGRVVDKAVDVGCSEQVVYRRLRVLYDTVRPRSEGSNGVHKLTVRVATIVSIRFV